MAEREREILQVGKLGKKKFVRIKQIMQGISISLKGQFRTRGRFGSLMTYEGTNASRDTAIEDAGKVWSDAQAGHWEK